MLNFSQVCWEGFKISTSEEWSSLGEEANSGGGGNNVTSGGSVVNTNNNEVTNNLHLLAASAGLEDAGAGDSDSTGGGGTAAGTPKKRRRRSSDGGSGNGNGPIKMQTDVVRVPGLSSDLQQQITKFDSSEFDVSIKKFFIAKLTGPGKL